MALILIWTGWCCENMTCLVAIAWRDPEKSLEGKRFHACCHYCPKRLRIPLWNWRLSKIRETDALNTWMDVDLIVKIFKSEIHSVNPFTITHILVGQDDVEVDSTDTDGRTLLSWAAGIGQETIVKLLVDRSDVETDSKDSSGRTPLSWAAERGHEGREAAGQSERRRSGLEG
jgi:hypothetical protein